MAMAATVFSEEIHYDVDRIFYGRVYSGGELKVFVLEAVQLSDGLPVPGMYKILGQDYWAMVKGYDANERRRVFESDFETAHGSIPKVVLARNVVSYKYMAHDQCLGDVPAGVVEFLNTLNGEDINSKETFAAYVEAERKLDESYKREISPKDVSYALVTPSYNPKHAGMNVKNGGIPVAHDIVALEKTEYDGIYRNVSTGLYVMDEDEVKADFDINTCKYRMLITERATNTVTIDDVLDNLDMNRPLTAVTLIEYTQNESFRKSYCDAAQTSAQRKMNSSLHEGETGATAFDPSSHNFFGGIPSLSGSIEPMGSVKK